VDGVRVGKEDSEAGREVWGKKKKEKGVKVSGRG
jgi:hypothetical protein